MNTEVIQSLNPDLTNDKISMPYPNVRILEPTDAIALVLPCLEVGDLSVLCEINGTTRKLASIRNSATVISKLLRVTKLVYNKTSNESKELCSNLDIMEALT